MHQAIQAVVCAVDVSPFSRQVVAHGAFLARRAGARLYLVHAVHDPQDGAHADTVFERGGDLAHLKGDAHRHIEMLMDDVSVAWEAIIRFGDPVEQTADFVNRLPSSLVVSASHGVSGLRRLFIGTVIERLTRALNHPMLVIKPTDGDTAHPFEGFRQAVISCDRAGYWERSAPLMPLLQAGSGSRIHLVHAMEGPLDNPLDDVADASYTLSQQARNDRLNRELNDRSRHLFGHAESLTATVAPGVPQEMLLQAAGERRADLIVVGVRRSGKVGRWLSGSTTETLLRHAPCCVLTLPEAVEPPEIGGGD